MKKLLLVSFFAVFFVIARVYSQTEKGNFLLGGTASTGFNFNETNTGFNFGAYPNLGYFVANKFALGMVFNLSYQNYHYENSSNSISTGYGISPFLCFYFATQEKTSLFIPICFGISNYSSKITNYPTNSYNSINGETGLGFAYFMNPSIALETALYYSFNKIENEDPTSKIQLRLGFQIHLKK